MQGDTSPFTVPSLKIMQNSLDTISFRYLRVSVRSGCMCQQCRVCVLTLVEIIPAYAPMDTVGMVSSAAQVNNLIIL